MLPVRFRSSLALSFAIGVFACSLPIAASASRHGAASATRPEPAFHPSRPVVLPPRARGAEPPPHADLPQFIRNPLRLRRMAYAAQPTVER